MLKVFWINISTVTWRFASDAQLKLALSGVLIFRNTQEPGPTLSWILHCSLAKASQTMSYSSKTPISLLLIVMLKFILTPAPRWQIHTLGRRNKLYKLVWDCNPLQCFERMVWQKGHFGFCSWYSLRLLIVVPTLHACNKLIDPSSIGAFTRTCSGLHLPNYIDNLPALKEKGVDLVAVISFNDPNVMSGWGKANNVTNNDIVWLTRLANSTALTHLTSDIPLWSKCRVLKEY